VIVAGAVACGGGSSTTDSPTVATGGQSSSPTSSGPAAAAEHPSKLIGDVGHGDAFSISLKDPAGKAITNLAAGTYTLEINDESSIHNFHLSGTGVDQSTGVGSTGKKTFSVTFKPGTYTFMCDPHAGSMHGSFTVS
jgi:plastocyanin